MARGVQTKQQTVLSFILLSGLLANLAFQGIFDSEGWRKPDYVSTGFIIFFVCCSVAAVVQGFQLFRKRAAVKRADLLTSHTRCTEDRLDELERLKRRNMVTPEEYAAKRQEILKGL